MLLNIYGYLNFEELCITKRVNKLFRKYANDLDLCKQKLDNLEIIDKYKNKRYYFFPPVNDLNRFSSIPKGPLDVEFWCVEFVDAPLEDDVVVEGDGVVLVIFVVGDDEAALPLVDDDDGGDDVVWFVEEGEDVVLDDPPAPDVLLLEGEAT